MVNAQEFIERNFDKETTIHITNQDLLNAGLTDGLKGSLTLEGFEKLELIEINDAKSTQGLDNDLTELIIVDCPELKEINVRENKLVKIDITKINTTNGEADGDPAPAANLTKLTVRDNPDLEEVSLEYCP